MARHLSDFSILIHKEEAILKFKMVVFHVWLHISNGKVAIEKMGFVTKTTLSASSVRKLLSYFHAK